jgi:NADH-quinone oxidoreductase subunit J
VVDALFYLMALGAVLGGVGVVVARSPVASVVSLLGTLFCLAVVYLLAGYQFLAAIQILV